MEKEAQGRGLTAEKAHDILAKNGLQVSLREAALVLDFCYKIATLMREQTTRK